VRTENEGREEQLTVLFPSLSSYSGEVEIAKVGSCFW
jgi:hypothetical protein